MSIARKQGFTLIEMMIALVAGLVAISSIYAVSASSNREFFEQQRLATTQGTAQIALEELRHEILRAGLFGTPRADLEETCDPNTMTLPLLGTGTVPLGAFQYYAEEDDAYVDPDSLNDTHADRLRILGNFWTNDQYSLDKYYVNTGGSGQIYVMLEEESQAFRRSFLHGYAHIGTPIPFRTGANTFQFNALIKAFRKDAIVHIETVEGKHFFRRLLGGVAGTGSMIWGHMQLADELPVETACMPGRAKGATVAPLEWSDYRVLDRDSDELMGSFMTFVGAWYDFPFQEEPLFDPPAVSDLEDGNAILVRRRLEPLTGAPIKSSTRIIAEWVVNFEISFLIDTASGNPALPPNLTLVEGSAAETVINGNGSPGSAHPEQVRAVIIDLALRAPAEDPKLPFVSGDGGATRYEIDATQPGSARIRHAHVEIPIRNLAGRNL